MAVQEEIQLQFLEKNKYPKGLTWFNTCVKLKEKEMLHYFILFIFYTVCFNNYLTNVQMYV